ncbi:MAG: hypothetical protein VX475_05865 [Myxococcota bacterium]|nr:hypothetical protein [Myxococcota bacterium]
MMDQANTRGFARLLPLLLASLAVAACVITDVGNPPQNEEFEATVQIELLQEESAPVLTQKIWLSAERFRLIDAQTCSNDAPADRAEGFIFEVIPQDLCEPVTFTKKRGEFCTLGLLLDPAPDVTLPANAPQDLAAASMVIEATRASDDAPVMVVLDVADKLRLDATDGSFGVGEDQERANFVISLDTSEWWDSDAIAAAQPGEDGIIRVDAQNNTEIRDALLGKLGAQITLHLDANGDEKLDDNERSNILATGGLIAP